MSITPVSAYGTAKWIVSATAGQGTHTTIATALTAASSGDTIFIRPGTYTENLTLKAGVNLTAYGTDSAGGTVTISGKCTFTAAGTVNIYGIRLQTNSDFFLAVTGSAASIVNLTNCYLNATNNTGISYTSSSSSSSINCYHCNGDIGTTGIAMYTATGSGEITFTGGGTFTNSGNSTTASSTSGCVVQILYCILKFPLSTSSGGTIIIEWSGVNTHAINTACITLAGTGTSVIESGNFDAGTASALSVGAGTTLDIYGSPSITSSNTNAITGSGTLNYGQITYLGTSSTNNVSVQTAYITQPAASSNFQSMTVQTFASSGTYTPTSGMLYCTIECVGGGGGGGGAANTAFSSVGSGGGGGEYAAGAFSAASIGVSQTVTIGAAGAANSGTTGGNGGNTSVGGLISANGGTGGTTNTKTGAGSFTEPGGAGGTGGSGGSVRFPGPIGGYGYILNTSTIPTVLSGEGKTCRFSGGAAAVTVATSASPQSTAGVTATGFGGGGSGGIDYVNSTAVAGGAGTAGYVVITEFV